MARQPRTDVGGEYYHLHNRANLRATIFHTDADYRMFERLLFEQLTATGVSCLAYVVMPNHWHLLVKTHVDGDLARFMRPLTQKHTQRLHEKNKTVGMGHIYQGRYKSHVLDTERYFLTVLKYIERNPVRAGLCKRVEDWQWGSCFQRLSATHRAAHLNAEMPIELPSNYREWLNEATSNSEIEDVRLTLKLSPTSVNRGLTPKP